MAKLNSAVRDGNLASQVQVVADDGNSTLRLSGPAAPVRELEAIVKLLDSPRPHAVLEIELDSPIDKVRFTTRTEFLVNQRRMMMDDETGLKITLSVSAVHRDFVELLVYLQRNGSESTTRLRVTKALPARLRAGDRVPAIVDGRVVPDDSAKANDVVNVTVRLVRTQPEPPKS